MTLMSHSQKGKMKTTEINKKMKWKQTTSMNRKKEHIQHHRMTQNYPQTKKNTRAYEKREEY